MADFSVWITLTELAQLKGVGKPALSERVAKLERQGLVSTKPGRGRAKLINLVEFDRAIGETANLAREQGAATRRGDGEEEDPPAGRAGATYTREQAKRMTYVAEIARLDLEERLGQLVRVDELRPVIEASARATAQTIDSLVGSGEELYEIARNGEIFEFNRALRKEAHRIRSEAIEAIRQGMPSRLAKKDSSSETV